jgi:hypothetical protein
LDDWRKTVIFGARWQSAASTALGIKSFKNKQDVKKRRRRCALPAHSIAIS